MVTRGLTDEMSCPVLSGPHNKDSLSGASRGHSWVPGTSQGPMGFLGKGDVPIWSSAPREIGEPDARANYVRSTRCCGSPRRGIAARPVWTAPTGTSPRERPGSNRDLHRPLAAKRNPPGFLGKGDVMIHRPYLVAWPVGSDWRTRRPRQCPSIH